jgi:predicted PolB exonuclease-like 3'-5' exonuclease
VLVFDLETVPDVEGLRRAWGEFPSELDPNDEDALVEHVLDRRQEKTGNRFLALHFQRIVAIGCLFRRDDSREPAVQLRCLGQPEDSEERLVRDFFRTVDRYTPQLVSWNGGGFDLPVLHYRAMLYGVSAPRYWEMGEGDREFKFNHYLGRYHTRHVDLMDLLSLHSPRSAAPLDQLALLCGFPGKQGMDGSKVWSAFREGRIEEIRHYCEGDVLNTWLIWCRFQLIRGQVCPEQYRLELELTRKFVEDTGDRRWENLLQAWPQA